jgi:hypothetical protein
VEPPGGGEPTLQINAQNCVSQRFRMIMISAFANMMVWNL